MKEGRCLISDFNNFLHSLISSTKGMLPLIFNWNRVPLDESHSGYQEVVKLFNAAMQSHLEA